MKPIPFILIGVTAMISISILSGLRCVKPEPQIGIDTTFAPIRTESVIKPSHGRSRTYYATDRQVISDTLIQRDTIYFYPKDSIEFGFLEVRAITDSIAGAISGRVTIQVSHLGLEWETVATSDINGSSQVKTIYKPPYFYGKFRVVAISGYSRMMAPIAIEYREYEVPQK